MKFLILSLLALGYQSASAQLVTESFGSGANAFTMDFVTIGNPNNAADTTGSPNPAGSVGYIYNLSKYEVSREQVDKANSAGSLGITLEDMSNYGGNGVNRPATEISWNEAATYVNWLNTSKGYQAAYNFTSSGANANISLWSPSESNRTNLFRHKDAYYFLPSLDEWHKAAYGSNDNSWYDYPTGSDSQPIPVSGGTAPGTLVFGNNSGPSDITDAGALSAFGTMGQGGNAWEWIEDAWTGGATDTFHLLKGGTWDYGSPFTTASANEFGAIADAGGHGFGFRVASVPEPSSLSLLALGGVVVALRRRR